jgi:predicted amidohydrolase
MTPFRIALANVRFPATPEESVTIAESAIAQAGAEGARIVCFPEEFVPGYRLLGKKVAPPDSAFLEQAWARVAAAAGRAGVAVILGTERIAENGKLIISALVVKSDGAIAGFQDKVQVDPSEEDLYTAGAGRQMFECGPCKFGVVICHEGWRYPETVRWSATRGAHIVFHPHFHDAEPGGYVPNTFVEPANSFHEKAAVCRAAENTCYFATVNCASPYAQTTSAVIAPDGSVQCWQPYGKEGLLVADIDLEQATGLLASRCKY